MAAHDDHHGHYADAHGVCRLREEGGPYSVSNCHSREGWNPVICRVIARNGVTKQSNHVEYLQIMSLLHFVRNDVFVDFLETVNLRSTLIERLIIDED